MEVHVAMLCTATKHNTTACVCTVNKAPTAIPVSTDLWQFCNIFLIILHVNYQNLSCLKKISLLECVKGRGTDNVFYVSNGVKQGGILSRILCNIYIWLV